MLSCVVLAACVAGARRKKGTGIRAKPLRTAFARSSARMISPIPLPLLAPAKQAMVLVANWKGPQPV